MIERHRQPKATVTARRQGGIGLGLGGAEDWLFAWESAAATPDFADRLLTCRPWASARAEISVSLRAGDGIAWAPVRCTARTDWPFGMLVEGPPVAAALVSRCDGRTSVAEHLAFFRQTGALAPEAPDDHFLGVVCVLISAGILGLDEFPWPPLPTAPGAA